MHTFGVKSIASEFWGQNLQKLPIICPNRHFQPNLQSRKIAISLSHETDHNAISREHLAHQGERRGQSKIGVKQIQGGGRPPSWKYISSCISAISRPICTKFGLQIDIHPTRVPGAQNYTLLKFEMAAPS